MKLIRYNGEHWYEDDRPIWRRVLRWAAWFGGWEAHSPKRPYVTEKRSLWKRLHMLTPVSLLGHRITFYGWGSQVKTRNGYWVKSRRGIYWSPNGTPSEATVWLRGAPREAVTGAREHREKLAKLNREFEQRAAASQEREA